MLSEPKMERINTIFYPPKETWGRFTFGKWAVVTGCFLGDYMACLDQFEKVLRIFFSRDPHAGSRSFNGNPRTLWVSQTWRAGIATLTPTLSGGNTFSEKVMLDILLIWLGTPTAPKRGAVSNAAVQQPEIKAKTHWRCSWHRAWDHRGPCSQGGFQGSFPCFFFTYTFYATPG